MARGIATCCCHELSLSTTGTHTTRQIDTQCKCRGNRLDDTAVCMGSTQAAIGGTGIAASVLLGRVMRGGFGGDVCLVGICVLWVCIRNNIRFSLYAKTCFYHHHIKTPSQSVPRMVPSVSPATRPYGAYTAAAMGHVGPPMLGAAQSTHHASSSPTPTLEQGWRHPANDRHPPPIPVAAAMHMGPPILPGSKAPAPPRQPVATHHGAPLVKPTPRDVVNAETLAGLKSKIAAYRGPTGGQGPMMSGGSAAVARNGPSRGPSNDKPRHPLGMEFMCTCLYISFVHRIHSHGNP